MDQITIMTEERAASVFSHCIDLSFTFTWNEIRPSPATSEKRHYLTLQSSKFFISVIGNSKLQMKSLNSGWSGQHFFLIFFFFSSYFLLSQMSLVSDISRT